MSIGLRVSVVCGAAIAAAGCRAYEARPLDVRAHRSGWEARDASEGAAAFAARVAPGDAARDFDVRDGLTLEEAEAVCLVFNAELRLARSRAGVAAAVAGASGLWADPVLGVDLARITESVEHPWEVASLLSFTIPLSGRLGIERAAAEAERESALLDVLEAEWAKRVELRKAWAEWSAAVELAASLREHVGAVSGVASIAERLEEAGEMARVESRLFRIARVSERAELRRAESAEASRRAAVTALMGLAPRARVELVPRLGVAEVERGASGDDPLAASAALAALRASYEAAEQGLRLAVRSQYPDLVIGPGYGYEDGSDRVLLGVSAPLPIFNGNRLAIARAEAARDAARAAYEAAYEALASGRAAALLELEAARAERRLIEEELAPLVDEQLDEARRAAELGEVDALLMLSSLSRRQEAKAALVDALRREAVAAAELAGIEGEPRRDAAPGAAGGSP